MAADQRLVYVADPMCSWCWGFAPVIESVTERFGDQAPVTLLLGGLRTGASEPWDEAGKAQVRLHWDHVHEATGQPFDFGFFERDGFVYDTELACRSVVCVRRLDREKAVPFLDHLHAAFYRDGRDLTHFDTLCDLAVDFGLDREGFALELASEQARLAAQGDFALARQLGVSGFPSLVAYDGEQLTAISLGYAPLESVAHSIEGWLEAATPDSPSGDPAGAR
jgi:putative protein-disulfide isomerase